MCFRRVNKIREIVFDDNESSLTTIYEHYLPISYYVSYLPIICYLPASNKRSVFISR